VKEGDIKGGELEQEDTDVSCPSEKEITAVFDAIRRGFYLNENVNSTISFIY